MIMDDFKQRLLDTMEAAGLAFIGVETAAKILYITYNFAENEKLCLCEKFGDDLKYISRKYNFVGGEVPNIEVVTRLQELQKKYKNPMHPPTWVYEFVKNRYDIEL